VTNLRGFAHGSCDLLQHLAAPAFAHVNAGSRTQTRI
jgi:hypothetical protein